MNVPEWNCVTRPLLFKPAILPFVAMMLSLFIYIYVTICLFFSRPRVSSQKKKGGKDVPSLVVCHGVRHVSVATAGLWCRSRKGFALVGCVQRTRAALHHNHTPSHPFFSSLLLFFSFLVCSCLLGGEAEEFLSRVRSGSSPNTMVWSQCPRSTALLPCAFAASVLSFRDRHATTFCTVSAI